MTGADVKEIRKRAGLLQVDFAEELGVHPITLSRYESSSEPIPWTVELALCELDRRLNNSAKRKRKSSKGKSRMKAALPAFVLVLTAFSVNAQNGDLIQSSTPFGSDSTIKMESPAECIRLKETQDELRRLGPGATTLVRDARAKEITRIDRRLKEACAPEKIETGAINGVAYQFAYSSGFGMFAGSPNGSVKYPSDGWQVNCDKDAITDEKTCFIDRGDLRIWVDSRTRLEVYVGNNHYPGSYVVLRIDNSRPVAIAARKFNGSFGYRASPAIIKRMTNAKNVTTRYQEWPYTDYKDGTLSLYGFSEALAYIRWAVRHIK